jgi:SNF2 family DNA or RNA helicase
LWPHLITGHQSGRVLTYEQFLERYCHLQFSEYGTKVIGYKDREGLVALLDTIMLRRDEIRGLPDLVLREEPTLVEVDSKKLAELEAHPEFENLLRVLNSADARANDLEGVEDDYIHLATLRRLTGLLKAKPAAELVHNEMGPGDKVVLFAIHREVIEQMDNYLTLAGHQTAIVHGGVPDGIRNAEIDRFNEDPNCTVFIGQIEACKECLNLPAANRVRLVEEAWSPETNAQAIARVHRRGQTRQVFADAIAIAGSIDEILQRVLTLKIRNIHALMKEKYHGNLPPHQ